MGTSAYEQSTQGGAQLAPGDAARVLSDVYGLHLVAEEPLPGEVDRNVRVTVDAGRELVLKVAGAGAARDELEFETRLLEHLGARKLGFALPTQVPTRDGARITAVSFGGRDHFVRLLT